MAVEVPPKVDQHGVEALYRRHAGRVHGVIQRLVGFHGVRAEDLTQEAFVRAWQALPAFRFESAFGTWLHRLAVNTALMELRSRRNGRRFDEDEDAIEGLGLADSAGHSTALSMDLERAVATLPPRARAVLFPSLGAYVGGDITGGATSLRQLAMRPRLGALGYRTGVSGVYLGGASTSPAAGVHGMSGVRAAECALKDWAR